MRVCLVGNSYISRLLQKMASPTEVGFSSNFGLRQAEVEALCKGGWKVTDVWREIDVLCVKSPEIVFLQIGGNDLSTRDALLVADDIFALAQHIQLASGARQVYIGKLFYRSTSRYLHADHVSNYNSKVRQVNQYLRVMCHESNNVIFWRHKGLELLNTDLLDRDGTHLNSRGQKKFYKSIRGAIIFSRH